MFATILTQVSLVFDFYSNDSKTEFASTQELYINQNLIKEEQFYTYNGINLCPWISENYYRSLFTIIKNPTLYNDLDKVLGFIPQWHIPSGAVITFIVPDTSQKGKFGAVLKINSQEKHAKKAFTYFNNKNIKNVQKKRKLVNKYMVIFLKEKYHFDFNIDYDYLMKTGLLIESDLTTIGTTGQNYVLTIDITTDKDTLRFPTDLLIPLPLKNVYVKKGFVHINESELIDNEWEDVVYNIYDSLKINLYNYEPPILTPHNKKKAPLVTESSIIYGPSAGFIAPNSSIRLEYYYNPFFYPFHNNSIFIHYKSDCTKELDISY